MIDYVALFFDDWANSRIMINKKQTESGYNDLCLICSGRGTRHVMMLNFHRSEN